MFKIFLCATMLLGMTSESYAYLDPGSGGILLQLLFGGVAGLLAVVKLYWSSIKTRFKSIFCKDKN